MARLALALLCLSLAAAPIAHAQPTWHSSAGSERDAEARTRAKRLSKAAAAHYQAGRFAAALTHYRRAYDVYPVPDLLFNMGQCQRRLGHHAKAIRLFEMYRRDQPDGAHGELAADLIRESRDALAARQARSLRVTRDPARPPPTIDLRPASHRPAPAEPRFYETWWFWTAAGAAMTAGGAYLLLTSESDSLPGGSIGSIDAR